MYYEIFDFIKSMKWVNIIANRQLMEPLFFDIWRKNVVKIGLILQDLFLLISAKNQFQKLIDPSLEREFYGRSNDICLISFWNDWKKHLNTLTYQRQDISGTRHIRSTAFHGHAILGALHTRDMLQMTLYTRYQVHDTLGSGTRHYATISFK